MTLSFQITPLGIELGRTKSAPQLIRLTPRVERHATVALALRSFVVAVEAGRMIELVGDLLWLGANLLQTDHVGRLLRKPVKEPLARSRADAIDVEGNDAHSRCTIPQKGNTRR
jgi:hypothetical protein